MIRHYPRYKLRTLLILLGVLPPVLAWLWMTPEWDRYRDARTAVQARKDELDRSRADPAQNFATSFPIWKFVVRLHELRYAQADADARRKSILYRLLTPQPAPPIGPSPNAPL